MKKFYIFFIALLLVMPVLHSRAQTLDLLWQGESYVPPFYKGKTLWSKQSRITFLAIPQGLGDPENLTYKWTHNGTVLGHANGIGKNILSISDGIISQPQTIKVSIISLKKSLISSEKNVLASASVTLEPRPPILAIYENNPLYGFMFHRETSGVHELQDKEITLTAFPVFFSTPNRSNNQINYEWRTNSEKKATTENSVTYRAPDDAIGSSQISVRASNKDQILQSANKNFLLRFGK